MILKPIQQPKCFFTKNDNWQSLLWSWKLDTFNAVVTELLGGCRVKRSKLYWPCCVLEWCCGCWGLMMTVLVGPVCHYCPLLWSLTGEATLPLTTLDTPPPHSHTLHCHTIQLCSKDRECSQTPFQSIGSRDTDSKHALDLFSSSSRTQLSHKPYIKT